MWMGAVTWNKFDFVRKGQRVIHIENAKVSMYPFSTLVLDALVEHKERGGREEGGGSGDVVEVLEGGLREE